MLSHVGPKYDDLVNIYCHAHWGSPHPSFRREDIWEAGTLQPMEHPEMLYLPPNLPGSTPRKPEMVKEPTEGNLPSLEEMRHHELIDLVKKLLVERASKPTPLTNPSKDATVAGHVSMNQESFVQSSQAILQGLAEGGYIHAKTPKFESFFGDDKKNKLDFDMWERQVLSAATTHSGTAVKQAMMQSLKGQALMVISAFPPETPWEKLLQALKIKYQDKASYDVLMAQFYGTKIEPDEKCASFGTRLEQKLNQVSLQYPNKISESMYWNCERERFFHGFSKDMRTNLRTQFDSGANYYRLLELARIVESESLLMSYHEGESSSMDPSTNEQELSKSPMEGSTQTHDSGVDNQGDINSHDSDMIVYESNETSTPSIEVSFPNDLDSQSKEIAEDNSVNSTMDVEVVPLRRSARDRKQTQLFGNPWLYRITYNLTPKVLSDLLHHVPDTKDSLADISDTMELKILFLIICI